MCSRSLPASSLESRDWALLYSGYAVLAEGSLWVGDRPCLCEIVHILGLQGPLVSFYLSPHQPKPHTHKPITVPGSGNGRHPRLMYFLPQAHFQPHRDRQWVGAKLLGNRTQNPKDPKAAKACGHYGNQQSSGTPAARQGPV